MNFLLPACAFASFRWTLRAVFPALQSYKSPVPHSLGTGQAACSAREANDENTLRDVASARCESGEWHSQRGGIGYRSLFSIRPSRFFCHDADLAPLPAPELLDRRLEQTRPPHGRRAALAVDEAPGPHRRKRPRRRGAPVSRRRAADAGRPRVVRGARWRRRRLSPPSSRHEREVVGRLRRDRLASARRRSRRRGRRGRRQADAGAVDAVPARTRGRGRRRPN